MTNDTPFRYGPTSASVFTPLRVGRGNYGELSGSVRKVAANAWQ